MAKETINEKWAYSKRNLVTKYWSQSLPLPFTIRLPSFIFHKMANAGHWMRTMQTTDHNWILLNMSYLFKWHWYSRWRVYLILFTEIFFWYEQLCMYDLKNIHIPLLSNHQPKSKWQILLTASAYGKHCNPDPFITILKLTEHSFNAPWFLSF